MLALQRGAKTSFMALELIVEFFKAISTLVVPTQESQ